MRDSEKTKLSFIGVVSIPRKQKLSAEEKVELVRQCINGEISIRGAAQQAGVAPKSVRRWIIAYESDGAEAFLPHSHNRVYSPELKKKAVQDALFQPLPPETLRS